MTGMILISAFRSILLSSRVLFYLGKNSGKVSLVISAPKVSKQVKFFGAKIQEGKMCRDLADQRDVFFFYLAVISYANSTCKVNKGEDADDSCPQNFFHSVIYVRFCHQDPRR